MDFYRAQFMKNDFSRRYLLVRNPNFFEIFFEIFEKSKNQKFTNSLDLNLKI